MFPSVLSVVINTRLFDLRQSNEVSGAKIKHDNNGNEIKLIEICIRNKIKKQFERDARSIKIIIKKI